MSANKRPRTKYSSYLADAHSHEAIRLRRSHIGDGHLNRAVGRERALITFSELISNYRSKCKNIGREAKSERTFSNYVYELIDLSYIKAESLLVIYSIPCIFLGNFFPFGLFRKQWLSHGQSFSIDSV